MTASARSILLLLTLTCQGATADTLNQLSEQFWVWRAAEQPFSSDDIPRIERTSHLAIDWSASRVKERAQELSEFERRWKAILPANQRPVSEQVDYRLIGSALARVRWELTIEQGWRRNPQFYVDQTLGSMYLVLLPPPPFTPQRQEQLLARLRSIPQTIHDAEYNLTDMRQPFAKLAIDALDRLPERFNRMQNGLAKELSPENRAALARAITEATAALEQYRGWLQAKLPTLRKETAIGRDN